MKRAVVTSLLNRVSYISPELKEEKEREIKHVKEVMVANGYPKACVEKWSKTERRNLNQSVPEEKKENVVACLPYVQGLSEEIRRVVARVGIEVAFKPASWRSNIMEGVKDKEDDGKKAGVVYEIKCGTCDKCYIGETGRSVETRVKEHCAHARNGHPELSAVAEHALTGHNVEWSAKIIERATNTRVRRIKEALLIHERDHDGKTTLNRDKGVELSAVWLNLMR